MTKQIRSINTYYFSNLDQGKDTFHCLAFQLMDADQEEEFMRSVGLDIKKSPGAGIAGMFASSKTDDTNLRAELEA